MKEHEKKAYLIAQGCNAVDKYGVPEPETLAAMQEYSDQQNAELLAWKESAMRVLNALDLQSLGRKLGIGLGQSVSENLHAKVDGLLERVKGLETAIAGYKECFEQFVPESKWDEATAFLSSYGNGLAKDLQRKENQ